MTEGQDPRRARWPDFFIVGAPRAGTTTMYEALAAHPGIFMPDDKEPHHFSTDLDSGSYLDSLFFTRPEDDYLALFKDAQDGQRMGEGSTSYLLSRDAAARIAATVPEACIIVMLRDPVEMIRSFHGRRLFSGAEDIESLQEALEAEADRRAGLRIPATARNVPALFYRDVARYGEQLQRYVDRFPPERMHVILFDDFLADPEAVYELTLRFLGVDPTFRTSLEARNAARGVRSRRFQRVLLSPALIRAGRWLIPGRLQARVRPLFDKANAESQGDPPVPAELRARLLEELRPDVERAGRLIGRDLIFLWR